MKVLIVEDEKLAREYLEELLEKSDYPIQITGRVDSVKNGLKWFLKNPHPDLVFMDIDLGDGLCFEIFDAIDINSPVIFTTAYDAYAIKAFKVNSIDYLLKPFDLDSLNKALEKFSKWGQPMASDPVKKDTNQLLLPSFKERFIIKIGSHLKTIPVQDVLFFYSQEKSTFAFTADHRNYLIDYSLESLEPLLHPAKYFRINRKYIISLNAISDILQYSNSRLKVVVNPNLDHEMIVARDRVNAFKEWLDR